MATVVDAHTELEEFHRWLSEHLARGKPKFTVDQSLNEFRINREQRDRLREELREAIDHGDFVSLDVESIKAEALSRLRAKGIVFDEPVSD
jgi:hypothetical protein